MKKIIILGAGMVGRAIAADLSDNYFVKSVDIDQTALDLLPGKTNLNTGILDITDNASLASAIKDYEIVVSAVPGFLGYKTMDTIIREGKDLVDISFLPEDALMLDQLAKKNNVTVIMDAGIAPGLPNYIVGYHNERMKIEEFIYFVGGLPKKRTFPFEYKAPFSPGDVIEEYTRPARFVENGSLSVKPAMSDPEYVNFERIGTLEAFNTDGLRSLITTMKHIPFMKEKTLRYPGHINLIKAFREAGFFDKKSFPVKGVPVTPFDFTSALLIKAWKPRREEAEFTVFNMILRGTENGIRKEMIYNLYDEFDPVGKFSSMARTTGFTAAGTVGLILNKMFTQKGVFPPELVGKDPDCFSYINRYLEERNIKISLSEHVL